MSFSSFSEPPREMAPVVPIKPVSRRRFFTALAGSGMLALLGGLTLKDAWPSLVSQWTAQPLGIEDPFHMAWNRDLTHVAVIPENDPGTILLWDYTRQRVIGTLPVPDGEQADEQSMDWSPDGQRLLMASSYSGQSSSVICWNVQTQKQLYTAPTPNADGWRVYWSPDGQHVAVIGDISFVVLDAHSGHELFARQFPAEVMMELVWSPTGDGLALLLGNASSRELSMHVWSAQINQLGARLRPPDVPYDPVNDLAALAWIAGENALAVIVRKKLWLTPLNGSPSVPLADLDGFFDDYLLALSPDGNSLAANNAGKIAIWNMHDRNQEQVLFRGASPSFIEAMGWISTSQIAIIDGSYNRVVLTR